MAGPVCGLMLGDMGADVVKVERLPDGDGSRAFLPPDVRGESAAFMMLNRGKRGLALDLRAEEGRSLVRRLVASADVIIENFRPGTADRLGIGYETLRAENPGLIYCAVTGMGEGGPKRDLPTYDATAQATSGLWSSFVDLADPQPIGPAFSDQLTGLYAAYGILGALVARGDGGETLDRSVVEPEV